MTDAAGDTSIGGAGRSFPTTNQGLAGRFSGLETRGYHHLLEDLAQRYWRPVYTFIRVGWKKSNEDAKDLTQAFFLWLAEAEALKDYAPERGSFRTFLKVLLHTFLGHDFRDARRLKRGGGAPTVRIDDTALEESLPGPAPADPDRLFDQAWVAAVIRSAVDRVRTRLAADGRDVAVKVFQEHELAGGDPPSHAEVAARLGLKESQVRDHLFAFRRSVRDEIRVELALQTRDDRELEEEWRAFFES